MFMNAENISMIVTRFARYQYLST